MTSTRTSSFSFFHSIHPWLLLTGCLVLGLLLPLLSYINTGSFISNFSLRGFFREVPLVLIQMIAVTYFVYYTAQYFDHRFPRSRFSIYRFVYELTLVVLGSFLINALAQWLFIRLIVIPEADAAAVLERKLTNLLMLTQTLVVISYGILSITRVFRNLQRKQLELLTWQKEFAQAQFEALKNQLNPHFLFNSLSALSALVHADTDKAEIFVEKLSRTYRYLLEQREKEAVPLELEIGFLEQYSFLQEQRYGKKLSIEWHLKDAVQQGFLLPGSFLICLEYLIGSTLMSAAEPLKIKISIAGDRMILTYHNRPKPIQNRHLEDQLHALQARYQLLDKKVILQTDSGAQLNTISIPLIQKHD